MANMNSEGSPESSNIQAEGNGIAIGGLSVGGSVGGDIRIGHTIGYTSEQVSTLITQISTTFQPKPFDGRCPYKGLETFGEEDAGLFFGREKSVEDLIGRVKNSRTVFITGPSGSGKSSLVRAGLIPTLKKSGYGEHWLYATLKPGRDPMEALAGAFSRLKDPGLGKYLRENAAQARVLHECAEAVLTERADQRLVLFLDQFEEVFTQLNKDKAQTFIKLLDHAATVENGRIIILFSMRSDFVANCATYPQLNALLNQQFVQIGAMQSEELVSAIAQPALRVGLKIDPDLIAQIINDMKGEPGALPLMQFALKDLFDAEQAKGGMIALTLSDYLQHGGINEALERHANASLAQLSDAEKELARNVFSGLIEIGRGTQDTRRTALSNELIPTGAQTDAVKTVVQKLANARLITTDARTVTISHEKLIDAWPWLKKLVNENRDVIALQNEIAEDAKEWEEHKRDGSYLYTGIRLANSYEQLVTKRIALSGSAFDFINLGQAQQRRTRSFRLISVTVSVFVAMVLMILVYPTVAETIALSKARGEMIYIPAGLSVFGTENTIYVNDYGFPPQQYIENLPAFQIGKYEVSNYQYGLCVKYGNCIVPFGSQADFKDPGRQNYPVVNVTLYHANSYCQWLGQRLPTQFEWERAARGSDLYDWPWGNYTGPTVETTNMPWNEYSPSEPLPVDSNPSGKSPEGIYNLVGNVSEWTASFSINGVPTDDPTQYWNGDPETYDGSRFYYERGGSWKYNIEEVALFNLNQANSTRDDLGFRCAKDVK